MRYVVLALVIIAAVGLGLLGAGMSSAGADPEAHSWYVCKYVGTPGDFEELQTGQNPIFVDEHSIATFPNVAIGDDFADAQGHSLVIAGPYAPPGVDPEPSCPVNSPTPPPSTPPPTTPPPTTPPPPPPPTCPPDVNGSVPSCPPPTSPPPTSPPPTTPPPTTPPPTTQPPPTTPPPTEPPPTQPPPTTPPPTTPPPPPPTETPGPPWTPTWTPTWTPVAHPEAPSTPRENLALTGTDVRKPLTGLVALLVAGLSSLWLARRRSLKGENDG